MVENDMRPAIVNWLNRNNYYDAHECMISGYCDVIGCLWGDRIGRKPPTLLEMVCIELKMRDIGDVISQAQSNHYHANLSYCAMPIDICTVMRPQSILKFSHAGVGLLSVDNESIKIIIYSNYKNKPPHEIFRKRLWAFKLRDEKRVTRLPA